MDDESVTSLFSWSEALDHLYRQLMPATGRTVAEVASVLRTEPEELRRQMAPLVRRGILNVSEDEVLTVASPDEAVTHTLSLQRQLMQSMAEELGRITSVLPAMLDAGPYAPLQEKGHVAGEVRNDADITKVLVDWVQGSTGDICFLRPESGFLPGEEVLIAAVDQAIAKGRRVRSIYPASALAEAPEALEVRVAAGEEVRVVPQVGTRMVVVGVWRALIPEPLGLGSKRHVALRQPAVVAACQAWFDLMWERGTPVLDGRAVQDRRRALLVQLARGVKDEQIARNLDVSLRTVRRGVADLLLELGVDTRFQAGVEAVRRGWL